MFAFVSSAGLPLKASHSFVNGASTSDFGGHKLCTDDASKHSFNTTTPMMVDGEKKKFSLPSLKVPSIGLPKFGKSKGGDAPNNSGGAPANTVTVKAATNVLLDTKAAQFSAPTSTRSVSRELPSNFRSFPKEYQFLIDAKIKNKTTYDQRVIAPTYFYTENKQGTKNQKFDDMACYSDSPFWEHPGGWPREQANIAIDLCLKQLFGTSKLFKSDLKQLEYYIICVKQTGNLKEFIRSVGLSSLYKDRFFINMSNLRFVELNFKHFLGRAPVNQQEISEHIKIITEQGYEAEINSYIDSEEYNQLYGYSRIPAVNFESRFPYNLDMNRTAILNGAYVTPDNINKSAFLLNINYAQFPGFSIAKGLPSGWKSENNAKIEAINEAESSTSPLQDEVPDALRDDELAWKMAFGVNSNYWFKVSEIYESDVMSAGPILTHSEEEEEEAEAILKFGSTMAKMYVCKQ